MATERVKYLGKRELTIKEFEALDTLNPNIDYNLTDFPQFYITNEQMTFALTCKRLFNIGSTFICADEGNYSKGHIYQITGNPKTWEDITPLKDVAKLSEQNTFTAENTFREHAQFDKGLNSDGDISITNKVVKIFDSTQNGDGTNKDLVTQYAADEIQREENTTKYNYKFPDKSGIFALLVDTINNILKNSKFTSENSEDIWLAENIDSSITIKHENGNSSAGFTASKNYTELFSIDIINNKTTSTKVSTGTGLTLITSEDSLGNKKEFSVSPEELYFTDIPKVKISENEKVNLVLESALKNFVNSQSETTDGYYAQVTNEDGIVRITISQNGQDPVHSLLISKDGILIDGKTVGSDIKIDNKTITKDATEKLQAVGLNDTTDEKIINAHQVRKACTITRYKYDN